VFSTEKPLILPKDTYLIPVALANLELVNDLIPVVNLPFTRMIISDKSTFCLKVFSGINQNS
jgi:hypothetical protein